MFNDNTGHCGSPSAHLSHAGSDIKEGHKMFTLAFVWQLMRAYTLSLLAKLSSDGKPVTEAQIIEWANNKVKDWIHAGTDNISSADRGREKLPNQGLQGQKEPNSNCHNRHC